MRKLIAFIVVVVLVLVFSCKPSSTSAPAVKTGTAEAIVDCRLNQLKAIPKLTIMHAGFPIMPRLNDPILDEVVRITGCVPTGTIYDKWPGMIEDAQTLAIRHNVPIVLNISPMHWFSEPEHVAQVKDLSSRNNPAVRRELLEMYKRCGSVLAKLGGKSPDIVLLDCERYTLYGHTQQELDNLKYRYDRMYRIPKSVFGESTQVLWFAFMPRQWNNGDRWTAAGISHGVGESTEGTSFSFYYPRSLDKLYESAYHVATWEPYAALPMSVWVSLGSRYDRPTTNDKNPLSWNAGTFNYTADYEYYYSWWTGYILNNPNAHGPRYAGPLSKINLICFWPPAMDTRVPGWLDHFIAYCNGANVVRQDWVPCVNPEN